MKPSKYSILLLIFVLGCNSNDKATPPPSNQAEQIIKKFELTETIEGTTNFRLNADKALLYGDRTIVYEVILNFYKLGTPYATLTSDSGVIFGATNDMEAMSNVKVVGVDGVKLETNSLKWSNGEAKIRTEDRVIITTKENKKVEGINFESDPGLTHIKLKETHGYSE